MSEQVRDSKKLLSTLGLCARAGALVYGTDNVCDALRRGTPRGRICLVIEAEDSSQNTHKKLTDKCTYYNIEHRVISASASALGAALGRAGLLAAVGITDENLKRAVEKQLGV